MRSFSCWLLALGTPALALGVPAPVNLEDLKRAKTMRPRSGFRGHGTLASANAQLNRHLKARTGLRHKACEDFAAEELRDVLRALHPESSEELKRAYADVDGRRPAYATVAEMEAHWAESAPAHDPRVRDAHCHEAVMWFVHHLTSEAQARMQRNITLPLLPVGEHTVKGAKRPTADGPGHFYDSKVTCQKCHNGGVVDLGLPEVAPATQKSKARRCYTNYKELFNITCGPCDGIAGMYTGDDDKDFTETPCIVVGTPEEIPESERVRNALPHQFSVDVVGGSDRFGRTTNPIHDQLPGPIARFYGQIQGKWYMDAVPGADLWMLRHDTVYTSASENGVPIPFIAPRVTEIHAQTAKMRANNDTGPMVSLIHGLPSWMPGGCTCMPDPVGVPDISASEATGLSNMQYMGRIKLAPIEYLGRTVELDHWADWFFHIFMEVNKSSPYYGKAPRRLASAYAGTAVYDNWVFEDPKVQNPDIWYRGIPTSPEKVGPAKGKMCFDTKKVGKYCANITQSTFPPKGEAATATAEASSGGRFPFLPAGHALAEHVARAQAEQQQEVLI